MKWDIYETFGTCFARGATNDRIKQRAHADSGGHYGATRHEPAKPANHEGKCSQRVQTNHVDHKAELGGRDET